MQPAKSRENNQGRERRRHERLPTVAMEFFTLVGEDDAFVMCTMQNVSRLGMMVEVVTSHADSRPCVGQTWCLADCPANMADLLQGMCGVVRWLKDDCAGIEFHRPLDVDQDRLAEYLEDERLLPWETAD